MEEFIKFIIPRISKEGHSIIIVAGIIMLFGLIFFDALGMMLFVVGFIFCVYFFRDPERITPYKHEYVISPADGIVTAIEHNIAFPSELMKDKFGTRISIFLSVFNVHVNRVPVSGIVVKESYRQGKFISATLDKSSEDNERHAVLINTKNGKEIAVVQIAGLIARRIVCHLKNGDNVKAGDRYGIIKFGSRVDIYLPDNIDPLVIVGQTMIGGETILAQLDT